MMPVDYVALGPIFPTNTKTSSDIPLGLVAIREARQLLGDIPLVAIGGISGSDAGELFAAGAAAVALISDCWTPHFDAAERRRRSVSTLAKQHIWLAFSIVLRENPSPQDGVQPFESPSDFQHPARRLHELL